MEVRQDRGPQERVSMDRRRFNRLSAGGFAGVAFAAGRVVQNERVRHAGAQTDIAATPPARPIGQGLSGFGPTIASKAAELDYDLARIVQFVSEEIRYEPYAGALRGSTATLRGLAGNSADQALLLAALLTEAQIVWRFAAGALDDAAASALLDQANAGIAAVKESWSNALAASLTPTASITEGSGATPVAPAPSASPAGVDDAFVADAKARADFATKTGEQRATALSGQIAKALDDAQIVIAPVQVTVLPDLERSRHLWVQVADGPRWQDIAPALPAAVAKAMPTPSETFAAMPDDLIHTVAVRITVETLSGTALVPMDVASVQMTAVDAARAPVEIGVAPPQALAAAGQAVSEAIGGTSALVPYLAAGDAILQAASNPVPFTTGGGALDVLGGEGATPGAESCGCQDGDLVSLSWHLDITSPGSESVAIQRYLLDRLTPEARATADAGIDPAAILPLQLADLSDGVKMPAELTASTFLTITTGDIPGLYALQAPGVDPAMIGIASIGGSQAGLAASYARARLLAAGVHAFVATPQAAVFSVGSDGGKEEGDLLMHGDLVHQARILLAGPDAAPSASVAGLHPLIVTGILNQVAEDVVLDPAFLLGTTTSPAPIAQARSVGRVFATAEEAGVRIVALNPGDSGAILDDLAPDVRARIAIAREAGRIVVMPERTVSLDGQTAIGWWEIDPTTGQTSDVYANGLGYVETRGPGVALRAQDDIEEADILIEVNTWRPWYQRLGRCVGAAASIGGMAVAIEGGVSVGTGGSAAGALFNLAKANPNFFKDLAKLKGCY